MKNYLVAIACCMNLVALPAFSQSEYKPVVGENSKTVFAFRKKTAQGGARFVLSNSESVLVASIIRNLPPPPPNVTAIILEEGKPARYSTAPLAEIDKLMGGNGEHEIELQDAPNPTNKPIELDLANGKAPEDIFSNLPGGAIQPRNGVWTASLVSRDIVGCPAQIASAVSDQDLSNSSKNLSFSTPFKPSDLSGEFGRFTWNKKSTNVWESVLLEEKQGPVSAKKSMKIGLISETEMSFISTFNMKLPAAAVKVLGSGANCSATIVGKYTLSAG